jgi:hypothetical protein
MPAIDLYDSDLIKMEDVVAVLNRKVGTRTSIEAFDKEIKERMAEAGYLVDVKWNEFAKGGKKVEDGAMPTIEVIGRVEVEKEFDHDKLAHEIRDNILNLEGQDTGLIKVDKETERRFLAEHQKHSHD